MTSKQIEQRLEEARGALDQQTKYQAALLDRIEHLEGVAKSLALAAHHKREPEAIKQLKENNADLLRTRGDLENSENRIEKAEAHIQEIETELRGARLQEAERARDAAELRAFQQYLEVDAARVALLERQRELDELTQEANACHHAVAALGGQGPGFTIPLGSDGLKVKHARAQVDALTRRLQDTSPSAQRALA